MLFTFPFGGYYLFSIIFSTLSVLAGFYMAWLIFKACKKQPLNATVLFLKWAMIYGILSSFGPFLTGPLIVMGYQGTPMYFNAIYFYLHFQYNGLFSFLVLAILYSRFFQNGKSGNGIKVFYLLNCAILPSFALSLLWIQPSYWFNIIGGWGALLQLGAFYFLLKDYKNVVVSKQLPLLKLVFGAFGLKLFLQLASAFPRVAAIATEQRNFIISYLHLVLLGFISLFVFALIWPTIKFSFRRRVGFYIFFSGFIITELLLVAQSSFALCSVPLPYFFELMFGFSCFLPVGLLLFSIRRGNALWLPKKNIVRYLAGQST
jgi:hypothetical protein